MTGYPHVPVESLVEVVHGREVADPFRRLEAAGDPATTAWVTAQRHLTDAYFSALPPPERRDRWQARIRELASNERVSPPLHRGDRMFFTRTGAGDELPRLHVRDSHGRERVLLELGPALVLDRWDPSPDGHRLAYQTSAHGDERSILSVLDVDTGEPVDGTVDRVRYSPIAWLPDGSGFYYVRSAPEPGEPTSRRPYHRRVLLRRIGAGAETDRLVFGLGFPAATSFQVSVHADRWLVVQARDGVGAGNRTWLADLREQPAHTPRFRPIGSHPDFSDELSITEEGIAYLVTTDGAPRGRICTAGIEGGSAGPWREHIPEDPQAVLASVAVVGRELLVVRARRGIHELTAHDRTTGRPLRVVRLPGDGQVKAVTPYPERAQLWLEYTDYRVPEGIYHYRTGDEAVRPHIAASAGSGHPVATRHVTYASTDGTAVRMILIGPKDALRDRSRPRPTLLTGYGGFGLSVRPAYDPSLIAWALAGGLIAIPAVRGGGEEGEDWHRAGSREAKQNSFDDFTAAARWLIDQGWTTPDQLGLLGASNGGLLAGAALTQHPHLYRAAVCVAPLLDMVRYESFGLGPSWRQEYGTADHPDELGWLLSYSPYHHVQRRDDYPAVLFQVYDNDTRVDPLHARKMCARLQHANPAGRPVLFETRPDMGHGPRARSQAVSAAATTIAFLAHETGLHLLCGEEAVEHAEKTG